jgi:hypothetical protein
MVLLSRSSEIAIFVGLIQGVSALVPIFGHRRGFFQSAAPPIPLISRSSAFWHPSCLILR